MSNRTLRRQHDALRDDIGDLTTRRPLPGPGLDQLDPFLFLNHHGPQVYGRNNRGLPFGPHPHRGFETVTFILQGSLAHRDSGGHESIIGEGGVQWMTAGAGIIHEEVSPQAFLEHGGPLEILQLWVNLPSRLKMTPPRYAGLQKDQIPALPTPDGLGTVNLISGNLDGHSGPFDSLTGVFMSTVSLSASGRVRFGDLAGRTVFLYVVRGTVQVGGESAPRYRLLELDDDGDAVEIVAQSDAVLLFGHADPIGEPVVAHGPFVMNTSEEIRQAARDYMDGKFGAGL
jgi:redox-sensitive bicupin YhaK (pirin superfamily)